MIAKGTKLGPRKPKPGMSLKELRPDLAAEWDEVSNLPLRPEDVSLGSRTQVGWRCRACEHRWPARVDKRVNGNGCPSCAGRVLTPGVNDLASQRPELVAEWDFEANGDLRPNQVFMSSHVKVGWRCKACEHRWPATVSNREAGNGCPSCAGRVLLPGVNDLASQRPELVAEWNFEANGELLPNQVFMSSKVKVGWRCKACEHRWPATVYNRVQGRGCQECAKHGFSPASAAVVYFLTHYHLGVYKVGISGKTTTRLADLKRDGWSAVHVEHFSLGADARTVEKAIHSWWRKDLGLPIGVGAEDMTRTGGHTETIDSSALPAEVIIARIKSESARVRAVREVLGRAA